MGEVTVPVGFNEIKHAAVTFLDAEGNEVAPDAVPSWSSSDASVATVEAADDGLSAVVRGFNNAGSTVIEVSTVETADDGVETTVRATGLVNVFNPDTDAVTAEVTFSDEEPVINPL